MEREYVDVLKNIWNWATTNRTVVEMCKESFLNGEGINVLEVDLPPIKCDYYYAYKNGTLWESILKNPSNYTNEEILKRYNPTENYIVCVIINDIVQKLDIISF